MIKEILNSLTELLAEKSSVTGNIVIADIARMNNDDEQLESPDPIIVSVVNWEEESALRNSYPMANERSQPMQSYVVFILFCAYPKNNHADNYMHGLENLEKIKAFFHSNAVVETKHANEYTKVVSEFVSLNNEQLNHLWSCLGVKYMPSLLYRLKILIENKSIESGRP